MALQLLAALWACRLLGPALALENGLAQRPPMGWMTWQRYRCNMDCEASPSTCIDEQLIKDMADKMSSDGWLAAGYEYLSIDDCWMTKERDQQGRQVADPKRFPQGMAALGEYIHSKGLKFGIYGDIGSKTCGGFMGLQKHFQQDAETFAEWKIDYLKVDGCNEQIEDMQRDYPAFGLALNHTGRPIVYSCSWPAYMPQHCEKNDHCMDSLIEHCNLWRNFDDVQDSWASVTGIVDFWKRRNVTDELVRAAGPGHWNDPDMLLVGDFGLSISQQETQFALWALFAAPLFMSNDLRDISPESKEILLNREIIAVNQDPLGKQGFCVAGCDSKLRVWAKPLAGGDSAVVLQNLNDAGDGAKITFNRTMLPWRNHRIFKARDLYAKQDLGLFRESLGLYVHVSSCRMLRLSDVLEMMV